MFASAGSFPSYPVSARPQARCVAAAADVAARGNRPSVTKNSVDPAQEPTRQTWQVDNFQPKARPESSAEPSLGRKIIAPPAPGVNLRPFTAWQPVSLNVSPPARGLGIDHELIQPLTWASATPKEISVLHEERPGLTAEVTRQNAIETLDRAGYSKLEDLCSFLKKHAIVNSKGAPGQVLRILNLRLSDYEHVYKLLAPDLERFRIKIDFKDTSLILRRITPAHESGVAAWHSLTDLLRTELNAEPDLKSLIMYMKGQAYTTLPPLIFGGKRTKSPDASLGSEDHDHPTLVQETAYSESPNDLQQDAKDWLLRLVADGVAAMEEHATQCVILFKINPELNKTWIPAFQAAIAGNFDWDPEFAPPCSTFLSSQALDTTALTVEIWRNEVDAASGGLKRHRSARGRPSLCTPVCISIDTISTTDLFNTWIWEYLAASRVRRHTSFHAIQDKPPIPRSTVPSDGASYSRGYVTLYLDDMLSPPEIRSEDRGTIWINIPVRMWVWAYLRSAKVGTTSWRIPGPGLNLRGQNGGAEENKENLAVPKSEPGRRVLEEVEVNGKGPKRRRLETNS